MNDPTMKPEQYQQNYGSPGDQLREWMTEDFANRSGIPLDTLESLLEGKEPLTPELAASLQTATSIPADIWLGFETNYRTHQINRGGLL